MRFSLYRKFWIAYALFFLFAFTAVSTVVSETVLANLIEKKAGDLYKESYYIASEITSSYRTDSVSEANLSQSLTSLGKYEDTSIWLLDMEGNVIASSGKEYLHKQINEFDATDMGSKPYTIGTFYGHFPERVLSVMSPVTRGFQTVGYVVIHLPQSQLYAERDREMNQIYIAMVIICLLSLIILLVFTLSVYYPLRSINQGAREYADGNYRYKIYVDSSDEIGELGDTMNYMAGKMGEADDYQKKFIANISHDFRSPLTSIKGYLQAIQDGVIPQEMQGKYIDIIIRETERLEKLTNGLLTLNDMSSNRNTLDITTFDINAVIKNTVSSFEGRCIERRILVDLVFHYKTQPVSADMGKIQQVIYNLLDNAIKFSNNNSTIKIETTARHEKVFISVKDSGVGIPKESIPKIWERFYKTDQSRGKDKKGSGLGLSIVKEIITAHGENINCISTEGVGTEFIFSLPRVQEGEE